MEKYCCAQYPTFHTGTWGPGQAGFNTDCGFLLLYPDEFKGRKVWIATNEIPPRAGVYCKNCKNVVERKQKRKTYSAAISGS